MRTSSTLGLAAGLATAALASGCVSVKKAIFAPGAPPALGSSEIELRDLGAAQHRAEPTVEASTVASPPNDASRPLCLEAAMDGAAPWGDDIEEDEYLQDMLRRQRAAWPHIQLADVRECALLLQAYYEEKSGRRQGWLDAGSVVSFTGALGAGLTGRIGVSTQRAWLGGAFLPVVLSDYTAQEPLRDLYHAGSAGLQLVTIRYEQLDALASVIDELVRQDTAAPAAAPNCGLAQSAVDVVTRWKHGDDRAAILPEAQRLLAGCSNLVLADRETDLVISSARALRNLTTQRYATDVLALDRLIVAKSRDLRHTPIETMRAVVSTPLRTLSTFLTGDSGQKEVDAFRTAVAFEDMGQGLSPVRLPELPRAVAATNPLAEPARARIGVDRPADAAVSRETVATVINNLDAVAGMLTIGQRRHAYRQALLEDLRAAAAYTELKFHYSPSDRAVSVSLAPPSPPTPPIPSAPPSPPAPTATTPPAQ